jgi:recombination protein RecA
MSSFQDFLGNLGPKLAKETQTGDQIHTEIYPTASLTLNEALGGGIGGNRLTLVFGNFSAGKTMLVLQTIGVLQKLGKVCGFVDVEGSYDPVYAESLGVNTSELVVSQVRLASQIEKVCVTWIEAGINFIGIDSISAMMGDALLDKKTGEMKDYEDRGQIGNHSVAVKRLIKGLMYSMTGTDCAVVLISQTTTEIGQTYVKQIAEGGKAPGFFSTQVIKLTSSDNDDKQIKGKVKKGSVMVEQPIGRHVEAKVTKNKLNGKQSTTCKYDIYYGGPFRGIDNVGEIIDMAIEQEVITTSGAWAYYKKDTPDHKQWNGRPKLIQAMREDTELFELVKKEYEAVVNGNAEE